MTDEERQRQMDFLLTQQAQFAANLQKLEEAQRRGELIYARLGEALIELTDAHSRTEAAHARTEGTVAQLAERMSELAAAQAHTDRRLDALIDVVEAGRGNGGAR